ncbi:DUF6249 domain-containing protein [Flavobacteriaceae bacterium M23B6Z8]
MEGVVVFVSMFLVIFGIAYLAYSTRNKERLALIEKGADASIFFSANRKPFPIWKIVILNLALLLTGIGIGIFMANILHHSLGVEEEVAFPGTIFLMAGIGLFAGYRLSKNIE